ncbi:hypothetical protein ABVK25_008343 [Lepraria finkii]|uniref:DUF7702 domain-containing protein n=1 Tax=Lepraria finkii TaxID=1340010 RepID=A0ABR4B2S8_9LECA
MLNSHSKTGIAQIVFYVPVIAVATFLVAFRHGRPRIAWVLLLLFSLLRLAGGIIVILLVNNPDSVGLTTAALALLSTGVFPLVVATLGLLRILYQFFVLWCTVDLPY